MARIFSFLGRSLTWRMTPMTIKFSPFSSFFRGLCTILALTVLVLRPLPALSQNEVRDPGSEVVSGPRLIVYLVVDQLRGDLLTRYYPVFTGGLKRLMDEGLSFTHALHNHAATETSPGHAALSTGVFPARAGIPANAWRDGAGRGGEPVYNVLDPDQALVGVSGLPGSSPKVLRRKGLADWVLAANSEARVISVSAKDRAAVLMAGKTQGEVFWFNATAGRFVTSTYYRSRNPSWLNEFNATLARQALADSLWESTIPAGAEEMSSPDTASFEGDGIHTFFPHLYAQERIDPGMDDFFLWFETTPMLDPATLALARTVMLETGAGSRDGRTDFLSVSLSQTDRVGHAFGPLSREQMDNLLRLDRALEAFLEFLDDHVGEGSYVVGLTADHGVMTAPEREEAVGTRLGAEDRAFLESSLGDGVREAQRARAESVAPFIVESLEVVSFVGPAYTHETLAAGLPGDSLASLFRHSFVPDRPGGLLSPYGVEMWWSENTLAWTFPRGSTHGSPFYYDRWVPLILMGPGIRAGEEGRPVMPLSLAPTLADLAGIPFPDDLDGEPLLGGGGGR